MKKYFLSVVVFFTCFFSIQAQCVFNSVNWSNYPAGIFMPSIGTFSEVDNAIWGGDYSLHQVVAGNTYEWSYCSADGGYAFYDLQITLFNNASGALLAYNDDFCDVTSPKITWTANFTGVVRVLTTEYNCLTNFDACTMVSRQVNIPSCNITNPGGNTLTENEVCSSDANGGCNMVNPAYTPISCGQTYFGTAWASTTNRDTDWYKFSLSQSTTVTITVQPEFNAFIILANASNCASPVVLTSAAAPACITSTLSFTMGPGNDFVAFVAPDYNAVTCGVNSEYLVSIDMGASPATLTPVGPVCVNAGTQNLAALPSGGTFSGPGVTGNTFNPATAGVGTHTISYTKNAPCAANGTMQIVVNGPPNTTINPAGPFCANASPTNLTANTGGGTWSGPGITDPNLGTFNPASANIGTNTVTYSLTQNGCSGSSTAGIVVNAVPTANITPAGPFCTGDPNQTLTASTPGGTWSGTGITNPSAGTFSPATAGVGTHTVNYSVTQNGCTGNGSASITVSSTLSSTINAAGPFCTNTAPVTLTAANPGGTWSGNGITNSSTGTFNPTTAGAGTHTITYTIGGNCGSTSTTSIVVNAVPTANITPAGPFCTSDPSQTLNASTPGGTWSGTGITNPSGGTFSPATAGVGTHTITYTVTQNGCTGTGTTSISVNTTLSSTITAAGPFCSADNAVNLVAANPGGTWSGTGITNPSLGTFDPAVAGSGTHTITYTIGGNCGSTSTTSIVVNATPNASINAAGPFCIADPVQTLTAQTPGGTWSGNGITNASLGEFTPATAGIGSHTVTYSVTQNGCPASATAVIQVNANSNPSFTLPASVCLNAPAFQIPALNQGGTWSGNGITNPGNGTFDPLASGPGMQVITHTLPGSCGGTFVDSILVNTLPDASILSQGPYCTGQGPVQLQSATPGGTWGGAASNSGVLDPGTLGIGAFTVTYTVTQNGCTATSSATFTIINSVNVQFSEVVNGLSVQFNNQSTGGNTYTWDFGDGNTSSQQNPQHTYSAAGTYTVVLIVSNSCSSDTLVRPVTVVNLGTENAPEMVWNVFPNPTEEWLQVTYSELSAPGTFRVLDMQGRILTAGKLPAQSQQTSIWMGDLPTGVYMLEISVNKSLHRKRIIKN